MRVYNENIEGSQSVSRHQLVGGDVRIGGTVTVGHNLRVKGWVDAPNLKGALKGLYATEESLVAAYPRPEAGWFALVGDSIPAAVWRAERDVSVYPAVWSWKATGEMGGAFNLALDAIEGDIASLDGELSALDDFLSKGLVDGKSLTFSQTGEVCSLSFYIRKRDGSLDLRMVNIPVVTAESPGLMGVPERAELKAATAALGEIAGKIQALEFSASALGTRIGTETSERKAADTALEGKITSETSERKAADTALEGKLTSEKSARETADTALSQRIDDEEAARQVADSALSERIKNEESARVGLVKQMGSFASDMERSVEKIKNRSDFMEGHVVITTKAWTDKYLREVEGIDFSRCPAMIAKLRDELSVCGYVRLSENPNMAFAASFFNMGGVLDELIVNFFYVDMEGDAYYCTVSLLGGADDAETWDSGSMSLVPLAETPELKRRLAEMESARKKADKAIENQMINYVSDLGALTTEKINAAKEELESEIGSANERIAGIDGRIKGIGDRFEDNESELRRLGKKTTYHEDSILTLEESMTGIMEGKSMWIDSVPEVLSFLGKIRDDETLRDMLADVSLDSLPEMLFTFHGKVPAANRNSVQEEDVSEADILAGRYCLRILPRRAGEAPKLPGAVLLLPSETGGGYDVESGRYLIQWGGREDEGIYSPGSAELTSGSRIYVCGNDLFRWDGTGYRNVTHIQGAIDGLNERMEAGDAELRELLEAEVMERQAYDEELMCQSQETRDEISRIMTENSSDGIDNVSEVFGFLAGLKDTETLKGKLDKSLSNLQKGLYWPCFLPYTINSILNESYYTSGGMDRPLPMDIASKGGANFSVFKYLPPEVAIFYNATAYPEGMTIGDYFSRMKNGVFPQGGIRFVSALSKDGIQNSVLLHPLSVDAETLIPLEMNPDIMLRSIRFAPIYDGHWKTWVDPILYMREASMYQFRFHPRIVDMEMVRNILAYLDIDLNESPGPGEGKALDFDEIPYDFKFDAPTRVVDLFRNAEYVRFRSTKSYGRTVLVPLVDKRPFSREPLAVNEVYSPWLYLSSSSLGRFGMTFGDQQPGTEGSTVSGSWEVK